MGKIEKTRRSLRFPGPEQFERQCRCVVHDSTQKSRLFKTSGKEFERRKLNFLIQGKLISPKAKWVCSDCLSFNSPKQINSITEATSTETNIPHTDPLCSTSDTDSVEKVITAITSGKIDEKDLAKLSKALGESLRGKISTDLKTLSGTYKDFDHLTALNCKEFLAERPKELIELFNSICAVDPDTASNKKLSAYCHLVEQLYFLKNLNFIGPFSFSDSLVKWSFAGSRACATVDGASSAAGSITSLKNVLKDAAAEANQCFEAGDVDVFFDNTQRVGKTRRVREGGSTPMDVATNIVFLQSGTTSIQQDEELIPEKWERKDGNNVSTFHDACIQDFNGYKRESQKQMLTQVLSELVYDSECLEYKDHVSIKSLIYNMGIEKNVCVKCSMINDKTYKTCPNCNHDANFYSDRSALYNDVQSAHQELPVKVKMGEIIGVNPNSRENLKIVLKNILKQCGVGQTQGRKWVRIGCDGAPYSIVDSLIDQLVVCCICDEEIDLHKQSFELHVIEKHSGLQNVDCKKVFGNILLTPGAGHIELNILRSCFSFCRHICIEHIAQMLGFCSSKAKEFIVNCGNHHLSWQIAMIIFHAFSQEILHTYVIECYKNEKEPCLVGFLTWKNEVKNANILFYYDLIFNLFLGLKCFRSGIRKNNSMYSLAGRQMASLVFFLGRHRIYQRLICRDLEMRSSAPQLVNSYIKSTESYTVSGDSTKGEGGDYITENQNKILKSHLPPGVPTFSSWQTASRCDEKLRQIRESLFERLSIKDPGDEESVTLCHESEIQMLRREIRASKLFENVYGDVPLKALNGSLIHENLLYFMSAADENFRSYIKNGPGIDLQPVFTTYTEEEAYNDINNWTMKKIKVEICNVLESFPDENLGFVYMEFYKQNVEKQNKKSLVQFLEEIRAATDSLVNTEEFDVSSDIIA